MQISAGDKLGPYEILASIGHGGMGEVFCARDSRLNRDVAIKISAERFSERFDREARLIASLNHPNICTLYDVGPNYLVMELVEGPTLAERIKEGPIPFDHAIRIARQMADALEAAHDKGIVHRDLKPGNIKIKPDGAVKVLDFGLAKIGGARATSSQQDSPTISMAATQAGVILGTAGYMSPEQARGKTVDERADIWAFGVILFEMLTGRRLFEGDNLTDVLASVVRHEPDFNRIPVAARRLMRRCLEKDPKQRLRHIGDAMAMLDTPADGIPAPARPRTARWVWPAVAAILLAALASVSFLHFLEKTSLAEPVRFQVLPPDKSNYDIYLAMSPDGRQVAFTAVGTDGHVRIGVRNLNSLDSRFLAGTDNAQSLFWSPDSRFLAFGDGNKLKKVDVGGGPIQTICDSPTVVGSGAWSPRGVIVFGGRGAGPLRRVAAEGGIATELTKLNLSWQETYHSHPSFLRDGRHFVYYRAGVADNQGIYLGSTDLAPDAQSSIRLLATQFDAVYAPSPDGRLDRLLFLREGTLLAQPFDSGRLKLAGEPVPVAEQVGSTNSFGNFSVSANGILAYRGGEAGGTQLVWFDREGKDLGAVSDPGVYDSLALSPDAAQVAVARNDSQTGNMDLWQVDLTRATSTRFTFDPATDNAAVWSPDGSRIVFRSLRRGATGDLYLKAASGASNDQLLYHSTEGKYPNDWSRDGRYLLYSTLSSKTQWDLWVIEDPAGAASTHKTTPYLQTEFNESQGQFSPDGQWVAYRSDDSGQNEVYVRPFPADRGGGGKWMVSKDGGAQPRWRRDGKELYYLAGERIVMAVDIATTPTFKAGIPKALFEKSVRPQGAQNLFRWDVSADGKRFLLDRVGPQNTSTPITIVLNWQAGMKR